MFSTRESLITLAAIVWAAVSPHSARADIAASLYFSNPANQIVAAGASIPVYVTLALSNSSDALTTNASGLVTTPIPLSTIEQYAYPACTGSNSPCSPSTAFTGDNLESIINMGYGCSDSFTGNCGPGPYTFNFNYTNGLVGPLNLNLQPGSSTQFLVGTYTPNGGSAPPGTYQLPYMSLDVEVIDTTAGSVVSFVPLADTTQVANDVFTRTVATPEPSSMLLLGMFVAPFGWAYQRRRRQRLV